MIICDTIINITNNIINDIIINIMAIARTPTATAPKAPSPTVDEKKIEALINKGGSSTLAKQPMANEDEDEIKTVLLRTYESLVQEIDEFLLTIPKRSRPSRNAYIVEAVQQRLQRDKAKRK
ncbi:hypothetical protein BLX24_28255 [Arsenicibacter rosenii]|uniref:Uncharacterized protein n=2 Tax=Arsenicibacter rosenii TaxID=1750698 RepID=A0A1S2VC33_9BACT|nr:hypothetical protein BLX24_28255 [Arsenicibacter rosenii]